MTSAPKKVINQPHNDHCYELVLQQIRVLTLLVKNESNGEFVEEIDVRNLNAKLCHPPSN